MPPKKRDKDPDLSKNARIDHLQADHELFLQAFEKPTQIYRFLRTRNMLKPIFLNRTLSYMRQRMSRTHKGRDTFKVDSLLEKVVHKNRLEQQPPHCMGDYMTLTFLGFYDKSLDETQEYQVKVETLLLKICHKKRKDSSSANLEVSVGCCSVPLNPSLSDPPAMASAVSISSDTFSPSLGPDVKSYVLTLRVTVQHPHNLSTRNNNEIRNGDADEPAHKRLKPTEKYMVLGSELVVYDKHNRCLLKGGEYDLVLKEATAPIARSPHKARHWETLHKDIDINSEVFKIKPTLKLKLSWSQEPSSGLVSRPPSYQPRAESAAPGDTKASTCNKENNRPTTTSSRISSILNKKSAVDVHSKTNGHNNGSAWKAEGSGESQIIYQFLYNNNSRQQTEACEDLHCPWCSLDCGRLYALLKHLKLCHSRFTFTYFPVPNGSRIDVSINELYDGSFAGSPHEACGPPSVGAGGGCKGGGPSRRVPLTHVLIARPPSRRAHKHPLTSANNLAEFLESDDNEADGQRPYITGHNRLYHHTITCLPVYPKELEIDSEGETDPLWLQQKTMMMIDEFTDVNEGEKELMKMWNLHVMKYNFVGDCQIAIACQMFLQFKGKELLEKNLYRNFVLHMCSLHDFGLITPVVLYQTIQMLNQILSESTEAKHKITTNISMQRDHWKAVGMHQQPSLIEQKPQSSVKQTNFGFSGESSPAVRRKTSSIQNSNRIASATYNVQISNAVTSIVETKKKELLHTGIMGDARKSIHSPTIVLSPLQAKHTIGVNVSQPLRRKSAGNGSVSSLPNRKRLSLQDRKNST